MIYLFSKTPKPAVGSSHSPLVPAVLSPGVKQPDSEIDHSNLCSADVKN